MSVKNGSRARGTILLITVIIISIGAGYLVGRSPIAGLRDENIALLSQMEQFIDTNAQRAGGFDSPDYDSGWTPIGAGDLEFFDHGLGTKDDLFVYVIGRYSESEFNQYNYGFSYVGENQYGSSWSVDDTTVYVERGMDDEDWEEARIYIWRRARAPDYDSGWTPIGAGDLEFFDHGLGTKDDLFVYVIGRYSESEFNQYNYGFSYVGENQYGSSWSVDDTTVYVERGMDDEDWEEARIYIWRIPQGSAGLPGAAGDSSITEIKYEEIILSGEDTFDYSQIIDLGGYSDVTISWLNEMENGQLVFWWNIKKSNGTYLRVGPAFSVDYSGGSLYEIDDLVRLYMGTESFKVGSKYLEISTYHSVGNFDELESSDEVHISIYATK